MNLKTISDVLRKMRFPALCLIVIFITAYVVAQSTVNYSLKTSVLDESSGSASSANSKLEMSSVGQPTPIGESQSANYKAYGGYLYTLEAACAAPPVISTASLPAGNQDCPYSEVLEIQAGTGTSPLQWTVIVGDFPSGLSLDEGTGEIEGAPEFLGVYEFTVQVTDICSGVDSHVFMIIVDPYEAVKADPTGDCVINVLDILMVANIILAIIEPTVDQVWSADCNGPPEVCDGDGNINVLDAVKIANIVLQNDDCP